MTNKTQRYTPEAESLFDVLKKMDARKNERNPVTMYLDSPMGRLLLAAPDLVAAAQSAFDALLVYNRLTGKGSKEIDALSLALAKAQGGVK